MTMIYFNHQGERQPSRSRTMKAVEFKTIANGNGIPCTGDLITTNIDGTNYRAEFYLDSNFGHPVAALAADSLIEKQNEDGSWSAVKDLNDDDFNDLVSKITPTVE